MKVHHLIKEKLLKNETATVSFLQPIKKSYCIVYLPENRAKS